MKATTYARFDAAQYLDDDTVIAEYLTAAAEDPDPDIFLAALGNVAKARGMAEISKVTGLGRESLYKALSAGAHPRFETISAVLRALGVKQTIVSEHPPITEKADEGPLEAVSRQMRERQEHYEAEVLDSRPFQNGLDYLGDITSDFLRAMQYVRFQGARYRAADHYLMFQFAPHMAEAALAIATVAREGMQNAARRELRFLLEASVKLSASDVSPKARTFEDRLAGLSSRDKRFKEYVASLSYFDTFEKPREANAAILSLYSELSNYVHATVPQFEESMKRSRRGESVGRESVATLNRFNKLAFQVYDLVLVRLFHGLGLSLAGDIFTTTLDDEIAWKFHKGTFVRRLSKCFDYKAERRGRRSPV